MTKQKSSIEEFKSEFSKITWTKRPELLESTKIALIAIFVMSFGIFCADFTIKNFLEGFSRILKFIFG